MTSPTAQPAEVARNIPAPIKRAVRQRCGFGCVLCGFPIFQYDHMIDFAIVQKHEAENITLLCANHHQQKTSGLLPIAEVRAANDNPHNLRTGQTSPLVMFYVSDHCVVHIGSNVFTSPPGLHCVAVMVDMVPVVAFRYEDGRYLLNLLLCDETNLPILRVVDNELVASTIPWDISFVAGRLEIRSAASRIFIDMGFDPANSSVSIDRGHILFNGVEIWVRPDFLFVVNSNVLTSGGRFHGNIGLNVGHNNQETQSLMRIPAAPRYGIDRLKIMRETLTQHRANVAQHRAIMEARFREQSGQ